MKILCVMTCYNRKEKTKKCIESLNSQGEDINYVVVDDSSSDGTYEMLSEMSNVKVLRGDGGLFWNKGMHLGLEYVLNEIKNNEIPDYVMLANDDVFFFENSIKEMIKIGKKNESVVVGTICTPDGKLIYGGVKSRSKYLVRLEILGIDNVEPCDTFNANCVLIPWKLFIKVGNIDKYYKHAMGDFDYGFSFSKKKIPIVHTNYYVGECEENSIVGTWQDTSLTRLERIKKKESIKGLPVKDWWHFVSKNYGIATACYHLITPYIRILLGK